MMSDSQALNPGSDEAAERGCTCARLDNAKGLGIGGNGERNGWWISYDCPLHAVKGVHNEG